MWQVGWAWRRATVITPRHYSQRKALGRDFHFTAVILKVDFKFNAGKMKKSVTLVTRCLHDG